MVAVECRMREFARPNFGRRVPRASSLPLLLIGHVVTTRLAFVMDIGNPAIRVGRSNINQLRQRGSAARFAGARLGTWLPRAVADPCAILESSAGVWFS